MRLVFAGTPAAAVPSLDALLKSRHEVAAVITRPDAPAGRGRRVGPSPVAERAAEVGLELLKPARPRDEGFLQRMRALAPDCCPVTAYGALIPQAALEIPRYGWVNLHFSLLPAWRGAAPVAHAIANGDDITGATTFRLVAELDAGPVYGVVTEPIGDRATASARPGGAVGRQGSSVRRDRDAPRRAWRRAAAGQAADERRRVGARPAPGAGQRGPGALGVQLTWRGVPRPGGAPGARTNG